MTDLLYKELSYKVIGIAIDIHNTLGPGFSEKIYQRALEQELHLRKISFESQKRTKILYKNIDLGYQVVDLIVDNKIIVEMKVANEILPIHCAQLKSYLMATDYQLGLIINFGSTSLQSKRIAVSRISKKYSQNSLKSSN
jgi:GxxExxY protein